MRDCASNQGGVRRKGRATTETSPATRHAGDAGEDRAETQTRTQPAGSDAEALVRNWCRIDDPDKRRALFDLIDAVAASQDPAGTVGGKAKADAATRGDAADDGTAKGDR